MHGPHLVAFDLLGTNTPEADSQLFNITLTESQRVARDILVWNASEW